MFKLGVRVSVSLAVLLFLTAGVATGAFAQVTPPSQTPVFTPGNLVVAVSGCGINTQGGTVSDVCNPSGGTGGTTGNGSGYYGDDQGAPWTLWQYSVNGAESATYLDAVPLPQLVSGANYPLSTDYGSQSEGTIQLSGDGRFITMLGEGLNAATFNNNATLFCPPGYADPPPYSFSTCDPENGNPALAQTGSLVGESYPGGVGDTPVPRVAALIDAYGNVNSSTVLYNILSQNDARSAYSANGSTIYVSGQGCKAWNPSTEECSGGNYDDTGGVYLSNVGVNNYSGTGNPVAITGPDNGPTTSFTGTISSTTTTVTGPAGSFSCSPSCASSPNIGASISDAGGFYSASAVIASVQSTSSATTSKKPSSSSTETITLGCTAATPCNSADSTRMVQVYNGTLYVSQDDKPGGTGYNRSYIGTLGDPPATSLYLCASGGNTCPSDDGPYGPSNMAGFGNNGGTGKETITTGANSNGNNLNAGLAINLSPSNFFFASPTVLYVADTGFPKNSSNGPDSVCTGFGGSSKATVGDGGLQKWVNVSGTWTLEYTLYKGINNGTAGTTNNNDATGVVYNTDCNPNVPTAPGTPNVATGLYGLAGVVNGSTVTLYATNYATDDLIQTYVYGITDTLSYTTASQASGETFTVLDTAPPGSLFRGVSLAPAPTNGSETITSTPPGMTFSTSGSCGTGSYVTPTTLTFSTGTCTLSVSSPQNPSAPVVVGGVATTGTTEYDFIQWQDGTVGASDTISAPSTFGAYHISFRAVPVVVWPTASPIGDGQTLASSTLSGGSASLGINGANVPGSFAFTTPTTVPPFGTSSQPVIFTPNSTTIDSWVGSVSVTVGEGTTTISTLPTPTAITYGQALSSSLLSGGTAVSGSTTVPGTFAWTAPTTVPPTGSSSQSITFTPSNTTDYSSATGTVNVTVNQATPTINTPPTASAINSGQTLASSTLTGGSAVSGTTSVPGSFAFTTPTTVPPTGTSSQSITFTPGDTTDYTTATGTASVTVNQAAATISITNTTQTYDSLPEPVTVTTAPPGLGITVSYTGSGTTTYGPSATAPTNPGTYSVLVTITDPNYAGQQSGTLTINQVDPTVSLGLLSGSPTTTPYGKTVYFVLSTATTPQCPTGTAQLYVDGTASGSPLNLPSPCSQPLQFSISTLTAGAHSIYAAYSGDTFFETENTATLSYTVTADATTVTLATSGSSVNVGQSVTFTATVTPAPPNNTAPAGTVTFLDGSTQIGTGSTLTATAPYTSTFTTSSLAAGSHNISATFTDTDGNFVGNSSGVDVETVNLIVPTINWTPSPTTFAYGAALGSGQLNATAVDSNNNPISGTFAYNFASGTLLPAGAVNLTATFTPADPTTYASNSAMVTITVTQATPTVSVWPTASAINSGQTLVSSTLTGGTASVPGAFAFTTPSTAPAPGTAAQSVTFTPTDTTDYTSVTGTVNVTVNQAAATISITNTTQTYSGSPEPVTITTTPPGLGITVSYTGTNSTTYGPSATAPTNPGTYSVLVTVTDPNYAGQQSGTLTINQVDPTVSLALAGGSPTTTPYGTTVYFVLSTATTPQCPTGTAQLYVDGTASGSPVNLPSPCSQSLQFQISTLTAGAHSLYAAYSGDTYFESENTSTLSYTVSQDATTVTLATSGTSVNVGQPLTFTATVTPTSTDNAAAPTGTVTFYDGTIQIGTGSTLTATSPYTSAFTTSSLAAGSHSISATFVDADGNFGGNTSGVDVETVNLIVPTINWTPSPATFPYGTPLGSGQLNATAVDSNNHQISGTFAYTPASGAIIPVGTVNLTATFTPTDPTTYATNSATVTITVTQATPTVSVWPTASAINYGQTLASSTLTGGTASTPGIFAFTTPSTAPAPGTAAQSVTFTPTDTTDYTAITGTVSVTVNNATTTITAWPTASAITYGQTLASSMLTGGTAVSGTTPVPGTFAFTTPGTAPTAGMAAQSVTFTPTNTTDYTSVTGTVNVTVNKAAPTVTFTGAPTTAVYESTFNVVATTNATTAASITASGACKISGVTVTISTGSGTCLLTASWAADANYLSASATQSTIAELAVPIITWATPAAITYGTALSGTQLDAKATFNGVTVAGTLAYTPATGTVLNPGAQTLAVVFTPSNTSEYSSANGSVTLQVNQAAPKITWATPAAITYGTALSTTQLDATASVPGAFVYSPAAGTVLNAGTQGLSVAFTPTNTTDYASVTATTTISVGKATPTITWPTPAPISYGTALSATQLDATASMPGTFVYSPAAGTVPAGGAQTLSVTFTPNNTTDYNTAKASVTLQVTSSTPTITWATPAAITYGTALSSTQLDAKATFNGATVAGTYVYTPASGTVPAAGAQTLSVVFTPSNTSQYSSASGSVTLQVNQATPKITWANPAAITYGTLLSATQLDATASVPGTFVYSPAAGAELTAGTQTLSATFTPTNTTDYATVTATTTISVGKATPTLTWPTPVSIPYGTALSATQLDATASVPGTFVYSPAAGTVPAGGAQTLSVTFTPNNTTDYNTAKASVTLQVTSSTPTITWATPAAITYGSALSGTQLDAKATFNGANVAGTYVYTPASGTVLGAGAQTLSVVFTPSNTSDYTAASGSVTLQVNQATPKITWAKPAAITYGTQLSATQLDATASVAGSFVYSPAAGTVLAIGTQTLSVTFTPTDATDYTTQTATTTITVKQ